MRFNINQILIMLLGWMIMLVMTVAFYKEFINTGEMWEFYSALMSTSVLIFSLLIWKIKGLSFFSPTFLFYIATFLLHLALVIIVGFNLRTYDVIENIVLYSYSEEDAVFACLFSNWFLFIYINTVILYYSRSKIQSRFYSYSNQIDTNINFRTYIARKTGVILLSCSTPAMLYNNYQMISTRMIGAYHEIYTIDTSFLGIPLGPLINLFVPGIFFILYSFRESKRKFLIFATIICSYYLIFMIFSGAKINTLVTILTIVVMYDKYFKFKINFKNLALGYLFIKVLVAVTNMRSDSGISAEGGIISLFVYNFINNDPIIDLLNELGGTILTPTLVMLAVRLGGGYLYGASYLLGPIGSILKGMRITDLLANKADMVFYLTDPARGAYINAKTYAMGGSIIGEWYLNFGWIGLILVPLFALCIIGFERLLFQSDDKPLLNVLLYCFLISLIMYSRQYITDLFWIAFYRFIVCGSLYYILYKFVIKTRIKKEEINEAINIHNCSNI